jgi:transcriptional regulator with XRE-family HTH domain
MSERAAKHVRQFLGQRLRALRKQRGLSQERLGDRAGLSGKFIGEVERGEKSISIDSLYRVSIALEIPLRDLTDVPRSGRPKRSSRSFPAGAGRKTFARRPGSSRRSFVKA